MPRSVLHRRHTMPPARAGALLLALAVLPVIAYEALEKTGEAVGPRTSWLEMACVADTAIPWRPVTGWKIVDRTAHEWAETRLFWRLAAARVRGRLDADLLAPLPTASALAVAIERVDR